jgi:hypothetical protein
VKEAHRTWEKAVGKSHKSARFDPEIPAHWCLLGGLSTNPQYRTKIATPPPTAVGLLHRRARLGFPRCVSTSRTLALRCCSSLSATSPPPAPRRLFAQPEIQHPGLDNRTSRWMLLALETAFRLRLTPTQISEDRPSCTSNMWVPASTGFHAPCPLTAA